MTSCDRVLFLYTTAGCHLCEQAETVLRQVLEEQELSWQVEARDIADDPELVEQYGLRIPVLQRQQDAAELGWPFSHEQLSRWLC